jgi:periplasmic protein TonB
MMGCLNLRQMQAYLEEPDALEQRQIVERNLIERHLVECDRCCGAFDRLAATNHRVNMWLSALESPLQQTEIGVNDVFDRVMRLVPPPVAARQLRAGRGAFATWLLSAKAVSAAIHIVAFSLLMMSFTNETVRTALKQHVDLIDPLAAWLPPRASTGGGGGGDGSPLPASKGQRPKAAVKQFVPPMIAKLHPKLEMEPSIIAPPDAALPQSDLANWGDPLSKVGVLSNGPGSGGGMGSGKGGGMGPGSGPGYGPGDGGGIFTAGIGISAPVPVYTPDPEFSEEARKAHYGGTVWLAIIIDAEGHARDIQVVKSLGMGLDEKAMEAVSKWKFRPAMKNGRPVAVRATVQANFRLL